MKTLLQVHDWCAVHPHFFPRPRGAGEDEGGVPTFVMNEKEKTRKWKKMQ